MIETTFALHPRQIEAITTEATEVLYGGAAGGGKSHLMRVSAISWCYAIPGLQVYLFRRTYPELWRNHMEGPSSFPVLLADWVNAGWVRINQSKNTIEFWNGSKIFLCHCEHEKHRFAYHGAEIHVLLMDELTHFTDVIYRFLRSRLRMTGVTVPPEFEGKFPRILCASNPGGTGHHWVKHAFVDPKPPMEVWRSADAEGGMLRQFIPAKLQDNPSLLGTDPLYVQRLYGLGDPVLVEAMLNGSWDIVPGAFFHGVWDPRVHVIEPFDIPRGWMFRRSFDWGSAKPASLGIWAIPDGRVVETPSGPRYFPRGSLIRIGELYTVAKDASSTEIRPNEGQQLSNKQLGAMIADVSGDRTYYGCVADPSIYIEQGGPSIYTQLRDGAREHNGYDLLFYPADNSRVAGWQQLRLLLQEARKERPEGPGMWVFNTCRQWIRTVPSIARDERNPDDIDTTAEDHIADETRYAAMSLVAPSQRMALRFGGRG